MRRLRAFSQEGTRAASELPPGPLGVPARSWLTDRSAQFACATDRTKAGPGAATAAKEHALTLRCLSACGAPEGACVPQGTSHKDFALFGAPSPLILRTRKASRQGDRMPCSSAASSAATHSVIPAKAGIQSRSLRAGCPWIPAFAGMTRAGELSPHNPRLANLAYDARTSSS